MNRTSIYRILIGFFLITATAGMLSGQNITDNQGRKQGKWVKRYERGTIRYEGNFKDDKPVGEFRYYYIDGKLKAVTVYTSAGDSAYTKTYHKNGQPMAEGSFYQKKKVGKWLYFSDIDGALISEEHYNDGRLNGLSTTFYPDSGKPAEIVAYKDGKREGPLLKFFPEGDTMTVGTYVNDSLDGKFMLYYPDGKVQLEGAYSHGIETGEWKYFDEDGNRMDEEEFRYEIMEEDTLKGRLPVPEKYKKNY